MHHGRMNDAIDLLAAELSQSQPLTSFYDGDPLVQFTLAVAYDRDDQHALAAKIVAKMTQNGQLSLNMLRRRMVGDDIEDMYAPAIDRHYFAAVLYEASGHTADARTEFLNYAGSADARRTACPPSRALTAASTSAPTQSLSSLTSCPRSSLRRAATGARVNFSFLSPLGRPMWEAMTTLAPSAMSFLIVGRALTILRSLVISP